jgi:hypothetical protein
MVGKISIDIMFVATKQKKIQNGNCGDDISQSSVLRSKLREGRVKGIVGVNKLSVQGAWNFLI